MNVWAFNLALRHLTLDLPSYNDGWTINLASIRNPAFYAFLYGWNYAPRRLYVCRSTTFTFIIFGNIWLYKTYAASFQNGLRLSRRETIEARLRVFGPFNPPRKSYPPASETQVAKWDDLTKLFKGEPWQGCPPSYLALNLRRFRFPFLPFLFHFFRVRLVPERARCFCNSTVKVSVDITVG